MRGPSSRASLLGSPITRIIPLSCTTGNLTVSFTVLSYAGTLVVTVAAYPARCPDLPELRALLEEEIAVLTATASH